MALFKRKNKDNQFQNDYFSTYITANSYSLAVNERQAMQLPALKACMQLIENSIASLPIKLAKKYGNNTEYVQKDERLSMLQNPNPIDTPATLKKQLVHELLLYGRAYLYVNHNHLHVLKSQHMTEKQLTETGFTVDGIEYMYNLNGTQKLEAENVIRFEYGKGVLTHSDVLETALHAQNLNKTMLQSGTYTTGVLSAATRLTDKAIKNLRASWENLYAGVSSDKNRTIILEEGLDYKPVSLNPDQLQLKDTEKALNSKICMLFNVDESLINSNSNKYDSLGTANTNFLQKTVSPILDVIEATLNKHFFTDEKMKFIFDTSMILRATERENVEVVTTLLAAGVINLNEARERLNYSVVDDEQNYYELNIGKALRNVKTGEILNINTQQTNTPIAATDEAATVSDTNITDSVDSNENAAATENDEKEVI